VLKPERRFQDEDEFLDGVHVALVTNNKDPENQGRVKVRFPWLDDTAESHWCRLSARYAGKDRGMYFVPEVGDEVLVVFELGDMNQPFVVGSLWNGKDALPEPGHPDGADNHKVIETRSGHRLVFDDTSGAERIALIDSSNNNRIEIDVAGDSITVTARTGNIFIKAPAGSVNFESKSQLVDVKTTKQHTSGQTHGITVEKGDYTQAVESAKSLTVGGSTSRSAQAMAVSASSSAGVTGGSATFKVGEAGTMSQQGPVTQTIGDAKRTTTVELEGSPVKTWTVGMATLHSPTAVWLESGGPLTVTAGMFQGKAGGGQFSLLGSPVIHLGGMINLKAGVIAFKPGG
jgi:hypothetical protein